MDNKDLRKHILPYWQDIYNLQYGNLFRRIYVRIKYRIFGNKFGSTEIPDNILEAIARTMLPDIREFFFPKRGRRSLPLGKQNMKRIRKVRLVKDYGVIEFGKCSFCLEKV